MSKLSGIPVTHYGVVIGYAEINEDGEIVMTLTNSQEFGRDLCAALKKGVVDGISVHPTFVPSEPKRRNVTVVGSSNVQIGNGNNQVNHW